VAAVAATTAAARLELTESDDPDPVASGAALTYTLAYSNTGDATAAGVVITDTLDPNVSYVSASLMPTTRTTSTLYWNIAALSPSISGEIVISVTVPCGLSEGTVLTNSVTIDSQRTDPLSVTQTTVVSGVDPACITLIPATATPTPTPTHTPAPARPPPTNTPISPTSTEQPSPTPTKEPTSTVQPTATEPRPTPTPGSETAAAS
jgi:uncharacterized repeat protein (TIGR01451 family)